MPIYALTHYSLHEAAVREAFGNDAYAGPPLFEGPLRLIVFSNRSGSNLLADYLVSTGRFARFVEAFHLQRIAAAKAGPALSDHIAAHLPADGTAGGFKVSYEQLAMLLRLGAPRMFAGPILAVHTTRTDMIAQAVSYAIAEQTRHWNSLEAERGPPTLEPFFDFERIEELLKLLVRERGLTAGLAATFDIGLEGVSYEELTAAPDVVVRRVARHFGVALEPGTAIATQLGKQGGALNAEFAARFRQAFAAGILRPPDPA